MWWLPHKPPADCESHIQQSQLSARQAGHTFPLLLSHPLSPSFPTVVFISQSLFTSSHLQHGTLVWYIWNICPVPLKMIWMVEVNPSSHVVVTVNLENKTSGFTSHCSVLFVTMIEWWFCFYQAEESNQYVCVARVSKLLVFMMTQQKVLHCK